MNDKQKDILKKYIKVGEPFGYEEAFHISAKDFNSLDAETQKLLYHHAETHKKEQKGKKKDIAYFSLITGRRGSGKGSYINYMECEQVKDYKYDYRIPLTTNKTFSDFERVMKLIDRKAKIDAGLPDRIADMWRIVFWIILFNYIDRNHHKFEFSTETTELIKNYLEGILGKVYKRPSRQRELARSKEDRPVKERQEEETHEASKILEIVEKGIDISYSQPTHSLYEHLEDLYNQGKIERPFPIEDVDIRADFDILLETYCIRQPRERDFESISKMVYDYLEDNVGITIGDSDQDLFGEKLNEVKAKRKEYKERRIQHEEIIQADFLNPNRTDELDDVREAVRSELEEQDKKVIIILDASAEPPQKQKHEYAIKGLFRYIRRIKEKEERSSLDIKFCIPTEVINEYKIYVDNPRRDFDHIKLELDWHIEDLFVMAATRLVLYCQLYEHDLWAKFDIREIDDFKKFIDFETAKKILYHVFPKHIENNLGSNEITLAYIARHTQLIPLQFTIILNQIWQLDKKEYGNHPTKIIAATVIKEGIQEARKYILLNFFEPYEGREEYQNAEESYSRCIPKLRNIFLYSDLERVYKELKDKMIETQKRNVLIFSLKNIEDLWTMFFEMGIFGIVTSERRAYVNAHFVYNDPRKELMPIPEGTNMCLHPLFSKTTKGDDSLRFVLPEGAELGATIDASVFAQRVKKKLGTNEDTDTDDDYNEEGEKSKEKDPDSIVGTRHFLKNPAGSIKEKKEAAEKESKLKKGIKNIEQFSQTMSLQERLLKIREQNKKKDSS